MGIGRQNISNQLAKNVSIHKSLHQFSVLMSFMQPGPYLLKKVPFPITSSASGCNYIHVHTYIHTQGWSSNLVTIFIILICHFNIWFGKSRSCHWLKSEKWGPGSGTFLSQQPNFGIPSPGMSTWFWPWVFLEKGWQWSYIGKFYYHLLISYKGCAILMFSLYLIKMYLEQC